MDDSREKAQKFFADIRELLTPRIRSQLEAAREKAHPKSWPIVDVAAGLALSGGKRLRAGLTCAGALCAGGDPKADAVLGAGVAWELLQAYLLIHDDWMDHDCLRRGQPTAHVTFARDFGVDLAGPLAILAGDFLCALAAESLARIDTSAERVREAMATLAESHRAVVIGQILDVSLAAKTRDEIDQMHRLKTGSYTVGGPLDIGAILAGATTATRARLKQFAEPLGLAFQLRDDLAGVFANEALTGKTPGSDLRQQKRSSVRVEAESRLHEADIARLSRMDWNSDETEIQWAREAMVACRARDAVETRVIELTASGLESAQKGLQFGDLTRDGAELLAGFAHMVANAP